MSNSISTPISGFNLTPRSSHILRQIAFVLLHLIPMLLASTALTLISAPLGRSSFNFSYLAYSYSNGWGYTYRSDYSLLQVLTFLLAYASGIILYPLLTRPRPLAIFAAVVCLVGVVSFAIELSHWFFDHHLSLIASFPILLLPIAVWTIISLSLQAPSHRSVAPTQTTCGGCSR